VLIKVVKDINFCNMADLNKFHRSRERLIEILNNLMDKTFEDERTAVFINDLQKSIRILDHKLEEFKRKELI
jgi:hypothetical protein